MRFERKNFSAKGENLAMTVRAWTKAGFPGRHPDDVKELFETHCLGGFVDVVKTFCYFDFEASPAAKVFEVCPGFAVPIAEPAKSIARSSPDVKCHNWRGRLRDRSRVGEFVEYVNKLDVSGGGKFDLGSLVDISDLFQVPKTRGACLVNIRIIAIPEMIVTIIARLPTGTDQGDPQSFTIRATRSIWARSGATRQNL